MPAMKADRVGGAQAKTNKATLNSRDSPVRKMHRNGEPVFLHFIGIRASLRASKGGQKPSFTVFDEPASNRSFRAMHRCNTTPSHERNPEFTQPTLSKTSQPIASSMRPVLHLQSCHLKVNTMCKQ